jgi:YggT family protein
LRPPGPACNIAAYETAALPKSSPMILIANILTLLLNVYMWAIIIYVIVTWLVAFGVLNTSNFRARQIVELLERVTDPVLKPIQKYVPPIAGIDLSPIIAIVAIQILKYIIWELAS